MARSLRLATIAVGAVVAAPALGAEITRVSSSGEPESPFGLSLEIRYERGQRSAKINREYGNNGTFPTGVVDIAPELSYSEVSNKIVPRLTIGLWHDLELRAEMPYVLTDDTKWTDAAGVDPVGGTTLSGILLNTQNASGATCAITPCPMFGVSSGNVSYAGGAFDDLKIGFAWGIFNERKDAEAPTWVVSFDLTAPTATRFDPAAGRLATRAAFLNGPAGTTSSRSPVGRKIWVYELATALSRRMGAAEPYFRLHLKIPQRSSQTYSNCEHATQLVAIGEMWTSGGAVDAATQCKAAEWKDRADAQPPLRVGLVTGLEVVPWEERTSGQRFSFDFRLGGEYSGESRWYNELTPATGKLLHTDPYLTLTALLGMNLRASRYVTLAARGSFQHDLAHFISGESMGTGAGQIVAPNGAQQNPNYDFRWDPAGRRFRVTETTVYTATASFIIGF